MLSRAMINGCFLFLPFLLRPDFFYSWLSFSYGASTASIRRKVAKSKNPGDTKKEVAVRGHDGDAVSSGCWRRPGQDRIPLRLSGGFLKPSILIMTLRSLISAIRLEYVVAAALAGIMLLHALRNPDVVSRLPSWLVLFL